MNFMKYSRLTFVLAVLAAAALTACSSDDAGEELSDAKWSLVEYGAAGSIKAAVGAATISFDDDSGVTNGSTGCNSFFGEYSVDGNSISFSQIAWTERACLDPPGVMEQESDFLLILTAVTSFEIDGDELRLISPDGELRFRGDDD